MCKTMNKQFPSLELMKEIGKTIVEYEDRIASLETKLKTVEELLSAIGQTVIEIRDKQ